MSNLQPGASRLCFSSCAVGGVGSHLPWGVHLGQCRLLQGPFHLTRPSRVDAAMAPVPLRPVPAAHPLTRRHCPGSPWSRRAQTGSVEAIRSGFTVKAPGLTVHDPCSSGQIAATGCHCLQLSKMGRAEPGTQGSRLWQPFQPYSGNFHVLSHGSSPEGAFRTPWQSQVCLAKSWA